MPKMTFMKSYTEIKSINQSTAALPIIHLEGQYFISAIFCYYPQLCSIRQHTFNYCFVYQNFSRILNIFIPQKLNNLFCNTLIYTDLTPDIIFTFTYTSHRHVQIPTCVYNDIPVGIQIFSHTYPYHVFGLCLLIVRAHIP